MSPRPNSLAARDAAFHMHGYTNALRNEQEGGFVVTRGKGIYVYDEDGKEYLDGMAALWHLQPEGVGGDGRTSRETG